MQNVLNNFLGFLRKSPLAAILALLFCCLFYISQTPESLDFIGDEAIKKKVLGITTIVRGGIVTFGIYYAIKLNQTDVPQLKKKTKNLEEKTARIKPRPKPEPKTEK